jgi:outer membrane protein OmpA-like peptidoglycan-associated protein
MSRLTPLIVASSVVLLSACATKDFVKETVAPVQTSVDGLGTRVQAHDEGLKALDGRLQGSEARILALQQEAAARAEAAKKLPAPRLLMSTLLTDDKIKFRSGRAQLTEQAGQELDQLVAKLKADDQPVFIEIQGHTDATGNDATNQQLNWACSGPKPCACTWLAPACRWRAWPRSATAKRPPWRTTTPGMAAA